VAFADRLLLNKIDLVPDEADLKHVEGRLRDINKFAPIVRCQNSELSVDNVLNIRGFDLARTLEMDPEFLNTDGEHEHDNTVTSLGINESGDLELSAIQEWVGDLLQNKGTDLYRMKGVLSIAGHDRKFVYQAVHMIFNGDFTDPWGDETRVNKLTFIGKNLDKEALKSGFMACLDTPEKASKRLKGLRFKIGDRVECNTGAKVWSQGKIVKLGWNTGEGVAPYQIELDDGTLIFAPADVDDLVRLIAAA